MLSCPNALLTKNLIMLQWQTTMLNSSSCAFCIGKWVAIWITQHMWLRQLICPYLCSDTIRKLSVPIWTLHLPICHVTGTAHLPIWSLHQFDSHWTVWLNTSWRLLRISPLPENDSKALLSLLLFEEHRFPNRAEMFLRGKKGCDFLCDFHLVRRECSWVEIGDEVFYAIFIWCIWYAFRGPSTFIENFIHDWNVHHIEMTGDNVAAFFGPSQLGDINLVEVDLQLFKTFCRGLQIWGELPFELCYAWSNQNYLILDLSQSFKLLILSLFVIPPETREKFTFFSRIQKLTWYSCVWDPNSPHGTKQSSFACKKPPGWAIKLKNSGFALIFAYVRNTIFSFLVKPVFSSTRKTCMTFLKNNSSLTT